MSPIGNWKSTLFGIPQPTRKNQQSIIPAWPPTTFSLSPLRPLTRVSPTVPIQISSRTFVFRRPKGRIPQSLISMAASGAPRTTSTTPATCAPRSPANASPPRHVASPCALVGPQTPPPPRPAPPPPAPTEKAPPPPTFEYRRVGNEG